MNKTLMYIKVCGISLTWQAFASILIYAQTITLVSSLELGDSTVSFLDPRDDLYAVARANRTRMKILQQRTKEPCQED